MAGVPRGKGRYRNDTEERKGHGEKIEEKGRVCGEDGQVLRT